MPCGDLLQILGGDQICYSNSSTAVENGKKFVLNNRNKKTICKIRVDDCLIKSKQIKKCDFLFSIKEDRKYFLVELKGQSLKDATEQIKNTFNEVNLKLKESPAQFTGIIVSSAVPKTADQKFKSIQERIFKEHKLIIKRKQVHYEENV